jgi:hypothetical protein
MAAQHHADQGGRPLGANLLLLADTLDGRSTETWRLWVTGDRLERRDWGIELIGRDDVDMPIVFLDGVPSKLVLETKTLRSQSSFKGPPPQRAAYEFNDMIGQMREVAERLILDLVAVAVASAQQMGGVDAAFVFAPRSDHMN